MTAPVASSILDIFVPLGVAAFALALLDRTLFVAAEFEAYHPGVEPNIFSSPLPIAVGIAGIVIGGPIAIWAICHGRRRGS